MCGGASSPAQLGLPEKTVNSGNSLTRKETSCSVSTSGVPWTVKERTPAVLQGRALVGRTCDEGAKGMSVGPNLRHQHRDEERDAMAFIDTVIGQSADGAKRYDLRRVSYARIVSFLEDLVARYPVALHGGQSEDPHEELDPSRCRPRRKQPSVFATTDARVALMYAIYKKNGPRAEDICAQIDQGKAFAAAMFVGGRSRIFEAAPGIAAAIKEALAMGDKSDLYSTLFSDGFVYIATTDQFRRDDPTLSATGHRLGGMGHTDHELNADKMVTSLARLHVSKSLAHDLFNFSEGSNGTMILYTQQDMEQRRNRGRAGHAVSGHTV
jgi:hypothetical protein